MPRVTWRDAGICSDVQSNARVSAMPRLFPGRFWGSVCAATIAPAPTLESFAMW